MDSSHFESLKHAQRGAEEDCRKERSSEREINVSETETKEEDS